MYPTLDQAVAVERQHALQDSAGRQHLRRLVTCCTTRWDRLTDRARQVVRTGHLSRA